jgi:heat shock protein HslJ
MGLLGLTACGWVLGWGHAIANPATLEGTNWKLSEWTGKELVKGTEINAAFADGNLAGSSGCNRYVTSYQSEGDNMAVKSEIASTMKACPEAWMKQEANFLAALKGVQQYTITKYGKLQLVYRLPDGFGILTFIAATPEKING